MLDPKEVVMNRRQANRDRVPPVVFGPGGDYRRTVELSMTWSDVIFVAVVALVSMAIFYVGVN